MNYKKIIFYQYDTLFDIFYEFKEKLNFHLIKADKNSLEKLKKDLKTDFLFISKIKDNDFKNQLTIDKVPIRIEKLIEQINLKFLKEKFSYQSELSVGLYKLNLNSRVISKNDKMINLKERKINLILFLKEAKGSVKINKLQKEVWFYGDELETHTVETHIYRLRRKIKQKFNDDKFIISNEKGYKIN